MISHTENHIREKIDSLLICIWGSKLGCCIWGSKLGCTGNSVTWKLGTGDQHQVRIWNVCNTVHIFLFIRNLALKWVFSFLAFRVLSFLAVSYPGAINTLIRKHGVSKKKHTVVSYALKIWVLGFLILKKFEYWFLINGFLIEKNVYSDQHCVCAQDVNSRWLWTNLFIFRHDKLSY